MSRVQYLLSFIYTDVAGLAGSIRKTPSSEFAGERVNEERSVAGGILFWYVSAASAAETMITEGCMPASLRKAYDGLTDIIQRMCAKGMFPNWCLAREIQKEQSKVRHFWKYPGAYQTLDIPDLAETLPVMLNEISAELLIKCVECWLESNEAEREYTNEQ